MDFVQDIRRFNRFYTRRIGLLHDHLLASGLSLPEGRVLYELATGAPRTAAEICRELDMDRAQMSRVVRRLMTRALVDDRADPRHGRRRILFLTPGGRAAFGDLDLGARKQTEDILAPLGSGQRAALARAMRDIESALTGDRVDKGPVVLRGPVPGDIGWVVHRQAVLYAEEYGWDWTYEALIAQILGEFATAFDPAREDGWIAIQDGTIVGSIFLMRGDEAEVARLRLLYVDPAARGLGLGRRLVDTCVDRARQLGYRRLTLWTNDVLANARRIYQSVGFRLVAENPHRSFGKDLIGQTWDLTL